MKESGLKTAVLWEASGEDKKVRCKLCNWRCVVGKSKIGRTTMKYTWFLSLVVLVMMAEAAFGVQYDFNVRLKIVDCGGEPIPEFEVRVHSHDKGFAPWRQGKDGGILLRSTDGDFPLYGSALHYQVIVRAPGFAPTIIDMERPKGDIDRTVVLTKGRAVELKITTADGRAIPDALMPTIAFPDFQGRFWRSLQHRGKHEIDLNFTSLSKIRPGYYNFYIAPDSPGIYVFVDHPGFMRAFRAGPFGKEELADDKLEIELPKPVELEIVVKTPKQLLEKLPYDVWRVDIVRQSPDDEKKGYPLTGIKSDEMGMRIDREFLAPADYWIIFQTGPADKTLEFVQGRVNPAFYRDMKKYSFTPGQVEKVVFKYTAYDENRHKGDHNVVVNIRWHDGKSAAGMPYSLYHQDKHFGSVIIKEGVIPDNGQIELTGLSGEEATSHFTLEIDKGKLGRYLFQLLGEEKTRQLEYKIAPQKGDIAPDITFVDIFTGHRLKFSDHRGKVLFVEFWATWCGPCQGPVEHLCEIASRQKAYWDGKSVLLCISIDDEKEEVARYVSNRGWLGVEHLWCEEGEPGFKSVGAKTYGITGVPTALLIDQSGRIVWRGHPRTIDIEVKIDELLQNSEGK
ncbi:MAG: TlpA family protein disulfide reductase [Planctomycetota bacterium]|nr:MAG: TlpA family protein disulfide reductase [Planctomycetota bacterium]